MKLIVFVLLFFTTQGTEERSDSIKEKWEAYKLKFDKQYKNEEEETYRMNIYINDMHMIEEHNKNYELGLTSYSLGENQFSDRAQEEFIRKYIKPKKRFEQDSRKGLPFQSPRNLELPTSVDWRKEGAVTPVKNQEGCGSCWAFAAVGALEGHHFLKTRQLVNLSAQNLVDCVVPDGCGGSDVYEAYKYIRENGIDTEESYPYEDRDAPCRYNPNNVGARIRGYVRIAEGNEEDLKAAVATAGPVVVSIDATHPKFRTYHEGIYDEPLCASDTMSLDHDVFVVGYGTSDDGRDYWIVKNSWGREFGKDGYIYMSRNKNNQCGIATMAAYPLVL